MPTHLDSHFATQPKRPPPKTSHLKPSPFKPKHSDQTPDFRSRLKPLCNAPQPTLSSLGKLATEALQPPEGTSSCISLRAQAAHLIDSAPLGITSQIRRVDQAAAVAGNRWLSAYGIVIVISEHFREFIDEHNLSSSQLPSRTVEESEGERRVIQTLLGDTVRFAHTCEAIARYTMLGNAMRSWVVGFLMGAVAISNRLHCLAKPSLEPIQFSSAGWQATMPQLQRLVDAISIQRLISFPLNSSRNPSGCWSVASLSANYFHGQRNLSRVAHTFLPTVEAISSQRFPMPARSLFAQQLAKLQEACDSCEANLPSLF